MDPVEMARKAKEGSYEEDALPVSKRGILPTLSTANKGKGGQRQGRKDGDDGEREPMKEGVSSKELDTIKSAVEAASSFMNVGAQLKSAGLRYTFATEPLAIYIVQPTPSSKVAIINKRYATSPDFVVGDIAVGVMD